MPPNKILLLSFTASCAVAYKTEPTETHTISELFRILMTFLITFSNSSNVNILYFRLKPYLFAIIFADDYECVQDKVENTVRENIQVYEDKALTLSGKGSCNYLSIKQSISNLKLNPTFENINSIESLNQNLAEQNCPTIY